MAVKLGELADRLRGRKPVQVEPAHPLAPRAAFRGDRPLLLLPRDLVSGWGMLAYRWRGGGLERLEPAARVRALRVPDAAPADAAIDVDVFPLDFPPEELVVVKVKDGEEGRIAYPFLHESLADARDAIHGALERDLGARSIYAPRLFTGLESDPRRSLVIEEGARRAAAVAVPGWITIIGPEGELYMFERILGRWWHTGAAAYRVEPGLSVVYIPEKISYFLAVARVNPGTVAPLGGAPPHDRNSAKSYIIPLAWRLPGPELPTQLREVMRREGFEPEQISLIERVVREVGPEWP